MKGRDKANKQEEMWAAEERQYREHQQWRNLEAWQRYYLGLEAAHLRIAQENAAKASQLLQNARP
jgi:hypothetical protein